MTEQGIFCDHFAFASAPDGRNGACRYGIVAKSPGVDDVAVRQMDGHLYPLGVDQASFNRSVSLLVLDKCVAFTRARNAGHDRDGRPNSIYSHTVLVDKRDFEAFGCDTRVIAAQCPQAEQSGALRPLEIRPLDLGMDFASARRLGLVPLRPFLESMFAGCNVAVRNTTDATLLQGLLSLLPPKLRLVPFTTMLPDAPRRHPFKLVQTSAPRPMQGKYEVIDPSAGRPPAAASTMLGACVGHLVRMIADGDEEGIASLYGDFASLSGLGHKDRFCVAAGARMYSAGLLRSTSWAGSLARMLDAVPAGRAVACFGRLERFLSDGDRERYSERYGARLLTLRHAGHALDAAAFADMLERCSAMRGVGARDIVETLLDERPGDMRERGAEILSSVASHDAAAEVVDGFAASPMLRPLILDALRRLRPRDAGQHGRLFFMAGKALSAAGSPHLGELFGSDACDLGSDDGALLFCRTASSALPRLAEDGNLGLLTDVTGVIHDRVLSEAPRSGGAYNGRLLHLRDALDAARAALARALRGAPAEGHTAKKAKSTAREIAATVDRMRPPPPDLSPFVALSLHMWPFWFAAGSRARPALPGDGASLGADGGKGGEPRA